MWRAATAYYGAMFARTLLHKAGFFVSIKQASPIRKGPYPYLCCWPCAAHLEKGLAMRTMGKCNFERYPSTPVQLAAAPRTGAAKENKHHCPGLSLPFCILSKFPFPQSDAREPRGAGRAEEAPFVDSVSQSNHTNVLRSYAQSGIPTPRSLIRRACAPHLHPAQGCVCGLTDFQAQL